MLWLKDAGGGNGNECEGVFKLPMVAVLQYSSVRLSHHHDDLKTTRISKQKQFHESSLYVNGL